MENRYQRQIQLPLVGFNGQKKIQSKKVLVVGAGGLGSYVASELCRTGVSSLTLVDPDVVELTNLQRQNIFTEDDVSHKVLKVTALYNALSKVNSETNISIYPLFLADFLKNTTEKFDLIMDCTDNFSARLLINDYAKKLKIPFIFGSCAGTSGSFMFLNPILGPELKDVFRNLTAQIKKDAQTVGILTPIVPLVASYQVSLALEFFLKGTLPSIFYQLETNPPELQSFAIKNKEVL